MQFQIKLPFSTGDDHLPDLYESFTHVIQYSIQTLCSSFVKQPQPGVTKFSSYIKLESTHSEHNWAQTFDETHLGIFFKFLLWFISLGQTE